MLPKFLQPERVPYASVEILRDTFHTFLAAPTTGPTLDAMLADNAAVDAAIAAAPLALVPAPVICAWCQTFTPTPGGLSHGICAECAARLEHDDRDARDEERGSACGSNCGYCGGCS